jgi:signal peptidase I
LRLAVVQGNSMAPALSDGGFYALDTTPAGRTPERGDVVVFSYNGRTCIKRVAAVAGDLIHVVRTRDNEDELIQDWQLPIVRRTVGRAHRPGVFRLLARRIPAGTCYVVGDNLRFSIDSRHFGFLPLEAIRGRVLGVPGPAGTAARLAVTRSPSGNT